MAELNKFFIKPLEEKLDHSLWRLCVEAAIGAKCLHHVLYGEDGASRAEDVQASTIIAETLSGQAHRVVCTGCPKKT